MRKYSFKSAAVLSGLIILPSPCCFIEPGGWEVDTRRGVANNAGKGVAIIIHRPAFHTWTIQFRLHFAAEYLTCLRDPTETLNKLFDIGGVMVGLGDYRPERNGPFGTFRHWLHEVEDE